MAGVAREKGTESPGAEPEAPIGLGSTVTLAAPDGEGKAIKFTLVEREDSDPTRGRISAQSPVRNAQRVGGETRGRRSAW